VNLRRIVSTKNAPLVDAQRSTTGLRIFCVILISALVGLFWMTTQRYDALKKAVSEDGLWAVTQLDRDMRKLSLQLNLALRDTNLDEADLDKISTRFDIVYSRVKLLHEEVFSPYLQKGRPSGDLVKEIDAAINSMTKPFDDIADGKVIDHSQLEQVAQAVTGLLDQCEILVSAAGNNIAEAVSEQRDALLRLQISSAIVAATLTLCVVALVALQTRQLRHVQLAKGDVEALASSLQEKVAEAVRDVRDREEEIIERLSIAAGFKDSETELHTRRVGAYSEAIAKSYGFDDKASHDIRIASLMHDIGKVGVPDTILQKAGPLTEAEFAIIKEHTTTGGDILGGSKAAILQLAADIARSHHERWDGRGYPMGLAEDGIPLCGRIVSLADNFDALTTARPYKSSWPIENAIAYIREKSGSQFDPRCVEAFMSALPEILEIRATHIDADLQKTA
jgi:putative two-component system response regulator